MQTISSRYISGIVVLFLLLTAGISTAANVNVIGRFGGVVDAVAIDGNYAYIGEGQNFVVLDISAPFNPLEMRSVITPSAINRITIAGSYAYLTSSSTGLSIVDISDPAAPILKGSYDTSGQASDVDVAGNYAYIADSDDGLVIVDITDPTAPSFVTSYYTGNWTEGVDISGNYAYVTDVVKGLTILDITDPTAPALAGSHDIGGARDVAVAGNYAYLTQYDGGLFAIDITDPSSTTLVDGHYIDDPFDIALAGNYAYVADGDGGLYIIDITNPSSLTRAGNHIATSALDVVVSDNYAYVAADDDGLVILDITDPSSITTAGTYVTTVSTEGVAVADEHAYMIDGKKGLVIANITDLSSPRFVTNFSIADYATDIAVSGNYAYLANPKNGLFIINITDPAAPTMAGVYAATNNAQGVDVEGNYAYIADYNNGLLILDITDPTAPAFAGIYAAANNTEEVDVEGNYAYVADTSSGLVIVDITDPAAPAFVGSYTPPDWILDVAVAGNYAYVAEVNYGLRILDITNPATPVLVGSYFTGCCVNKISVSGNYAQISYFSGLDIVDISNPSSPTLAGSYESAHYIHGVFPSGNYTYVADDEMGLAILCGEVVPTVTTYTPDYDNRMRQSSPNTVLSSSNYIDIGKLGTTSYRDVIWFDLSGYNSADTISEATLSLYWYYPVGATRASDTVVEVFRPVEWDPKYVTWNSRMSGTTWNTAGGNWLDKNGVAQGTTPYASVTFPAGTVPDNQYHEFDVTQLVQEYLSSTYDNTGFFLKAQTESGNYIAFYSSEWTNEDQRPKLTISSTSGSADDLPVASAGDDTTATTGSPVSFDGSGSTDDKGIKSYSWDFDDSDGITSEATGPTATKTYATAGTYTVTLTVTDTAGQVSTDTLQVVVTDPVSSVTYTPIYDNRLRELSRLVVFDKTTYLDVGKGLSSCRDLILFDLGGYNTTDKISRATLSLYWYYPAGATRTSDTIVEVYRPIEWDPGFATWHTAGINWFDKNGVAQGTAPYASVTFPAGTVPDNQYHEFDVTQLVQEYINGTYNNTGFFLKAQTESGNYIAFYSSDWSNADQRPKLTINS